MKEWIKTYSVRKDGSLKFISKHLVKIENYEVMP